MRNNDLTKKMVRMAVVAGLYAALTVGLAPISYGPLQFRLSEVMTLLAFIDPFYIPALTLGCFIANLFSPLGMVDIVFGTTATFLSVLAMSKTKNLFMASLWPVLFNGVIIGMELYFVFSVPFLIGMAEVALGEFVVVSILGVVMFKYLMKNSYVMKALKLGELH